VLVIGGGITGAGVARDAAMRGLRTVLIERGDLAAGTSSRSSRLVHGGLRYLEQGRLGLVFEALRERRTLRRIAPHLVRPLEFVFPLHEDDRLRPWKLAAGLAAYDLLAQFRNVGRPRVLGKRRLLDAEPMLRDRGLAGGASYYDAQCDDARLVVATARSAIDHGALVATYMAVRALVIRNDRVSGAEVEDLLTGERGVIEAAVVVNATGPWGDTVRRLEDPHATPLLRPTKGVHVVVERDRIGHRHAITFLSPVDGRVMFILPWGDLSYIGTTDTDHAAGPDDVRVTEDDIVYLLRSTNARFPGARLALDDVRASWAGLRPLLAGTGSESSVSREHAIVEGKAGMLTVAGGKLTTYRSMAAEIVDQVATRLGRRGPRPATDREPLPGGEAGVLETYRERGQSLGLPAATVTHILDHYGTEAAGIFNLGTADRSLLEPLHPAHSAVRAEVLHAARRELAQTVADVLVRRIHLFYETRDHGVRCAPQVAALLGQELGWGSERIAAEAAAYTAFVGRETVAAPA
jgi:glycerol-3-phosphate dehydrogenase